MSDCEVYEDVHGTAVTETVFDIASRATYYISNPHSQGDLQTAVNWMIEQNVDVINMSLAWAWDGPGDGTSPFITSPLNSVDIAVANGITWVNGAGNHAEYTWFGPFANPDFTSDAWHNFSGSDECNEVTLEAGQRFTAQLRWDDEWGGASRDLDLHLLKSNIIVTSSENTQSGGAGDDPFEYLDYTPAFNGTYCLAVSHNSGAAPSWIQLQDFTRVATFERYTISGSITNPAESANPGMLAVGATQGIYSWNTYDIEEFSSQGPTPDGRIKPDIVGADGGATVSLDSTENPNGHFFGTSQSSAHLSGLAALVKQRFPRYTPTQVMQYLKNNAKERGAVPNNTWGYGFAYLPPSDASDATPTPGPTPIGLEMIPNRIAFGSGRDNKGSGDGIYTMNADGSDVTYLFEYPRGTPIWSPDGRRVAFDSYSDGNKDIYVMNADGSGKTNLTNHPGDDRSPSWSPDGRRIAFVSLRDGPGTGLFFGQNEEIYVMNADGTGQTRLTNNPATDRDPSWSPDGRRIAFLSTRDDGFHGNLFVMNADGSGKTNLTKNLLYGCWEPDWSPDGRRIVCVGGSPAVKSNGSNEICVINADGSNPTQLTDAMGHDEYPSWSPDGRLILFQSTRDNYVQIGNRRSYNSEIYVMNADGSAQTNLTNHPAGDGSPSWLPITVATLTPTPDLIVDAPSVSSISPAAGVSFTLSVTVRNRGDKESSFTTLRYYRSTDATITTSDTSMGSDQVGSLGPSGSSPESIGLTAPSTPGTYYYGACVDADSDETDATNNCSTAVTVTVGGTPATWGAIRSFSPSYVEPEGQLVVTIEANNYGPFGGVTEVLPPGFDYVTSSLDSSDINFVEFPQHQEVNFTLLGVTSFTYTVVAPSTTGTYSFTGVLTNSERGEVPVGGALTIAVTAGDPLGPVFTDGTSTSRSVAVPAPDGADVGDPVAASHPDNLDITYSLVASVPVLFTIDEMTGQIRLVSGVSLVGGQTYRVTVRATDSAGMEAYIDVVIAVEPHPYDLNRNGVIEKSELREAILDYIGGNLDTAQLRAIIILYIRG